MHHAGVNVEVKFRDFAALSAWVAKHVGNTEGLHVTFIKWALTVKRRDELIRQVRERAVHDAVARAQLYADALGLAEISPVAIADAGMLVADVSRGGGFDQISAMPRAASEQSGRGFCVELVPQDIEVTASVDARFVAEVSLSTSQPAEETGDLAASELDEVSAPNLDVAVGEFRDDDAGYLQWLAAHADGYVVNIVRSYGRSTARLHRASCWTINGQPSNGVALTGQYVKVCALQLAELDQWAIDQVGHPIARCGACHPSSPAGQGNSAAETEQAVATKVLEGRHDISGPTADSAVVEAWADDYIRFENLPVWQQNLRDEIRSRCRQLVPVKEEVLHATFFGAKHPKADVENVLLYYIDSFKAAGASGIRFEHGAGVPPAANGAEYSYGYRYALARRSGDFDHWQQGRDLASFDWTDLGAFGVEKQLAQIWLALSRGQIEVFDRAVPDAPFAVKVQVRPPIGRTPVWGGLVKGVFDGVICALQAHTDITMVSDVAALIATVLPADSTEIEEHLVDQRRAVLGAVHRLVAPYRAGVKWDPSDHLCVAGELIAAVPVDDRWAIRGEVVEFSR